MKTQSNYLYFAAVVIAFVVVSACAPSPAAVETAIAATIAAKDIISTQIQAAIPTPTITPIPTATPVVLLDGDPRDYLPDLSDMPTNYEDASELKDNVDINQGTDQSMVVYGVLPNEYVVFALTLSKSEEEAKVTYQQLCENTNNKVSNGIPITRKITGYDEYKALTISVGSPTGYAAVIDYRYRNASGTIMFYGGHLSQDIATQNAVRYAKLLLSKLTISTANVSP